VGLDSGTSALELCLKALGVGPGDEVITAANTFIATVFVISHTGATHVSREDISCQWLREACRISAAENLGSADAAGRSQIS